ncbi:MAG: helix-turn-helix domain-containing protein [Ilumatobacteraceae bacterium]
MDAASLLVTARRRMSLSRRELARRGHTSPATLAAYEAGRIIPGTDTLDRLLTAAGLDVSITFTNRMSGPDRADELRQVLDLAEMFPARHAEQISSVPFPGRRS